jgi:peptide/nickel transport system substrate-binding protein
LEFLPASAFFGKQGPLTQGNFQLGMYTWLASPDPDASTLYNSRSIPTAENGYTGQNYPRYSNPKVDDLLTRGSNELATDKRKGIYCDAVKTWSDDVPVIPLFQRLVTTTARANMGNYRPTPTQTPETWNMWAWFMPAS